jgi:DNA transposition AAA+ family ATPase
MSDALALAVSQPEQPDLKNWPKERRLLWKRTREDGVPIQAIADAIGVSRSLLSQFLNDDQRKATSNLLTALQEYFKSINFWHEEDLFGLTGPDGHICNISQLETIITETWRRVWYVLDETRANRNFGMVAGPSGCGKTAAASRWLERDANQGKAVMITANGNMTRKNILRAIAQELGMFAAADADQLIKNICLELKNDPKLIIIDEADQICTEYKLETLRSLIDNAAGHAGIALIGNEDLSERILRMAIDKRKLARIHNRFGANQRVRMPTDAEAQKWLARVNLSAGARRRLIAVIQRTSGMGGFRVAQSILKTLFLAVGDREITEELLNSDGLRNAVLSLNA